MNLPLFQHRWPQRLIATASLLLALGAPTFAQEWGNSLKIDTGQFASVPHALDISYDYPNPGTMEFWFKLDTIRDINHLLGKRHECGGGAYLYQAVYWNDDASCGIWGCSETVDFPNIVGEWHHLAFTFDAVNGSTIYLDGMPASSTSCGVWQTSLISDLRFGTSGPCPDNQSIVGEMDEIRFWDIVRTPEEIFANYCRTIAAETPGLIGYWNFDEAIDNQNVYDISGTGNDGTLGMTTAVASDDPTRVVSTIDDCDPVATESTNWSRVKGIYR